MNDPERLAEFEAEVKKRVERSEESRALIAEKREQKQQDETALRAAMNGGVSLGDALKEALPALIETGKRVESARLKLREEIEPLYTAAEKQSCRFHPEQKLGKDWEATFGASWKNGKFSLRSKTCPKCLVNEMERKWIQRGVPEKVAHATFDNYEILGPGQKTALMQFRALFDHGKGFVLAIGECGNGKSHLLASLLKAVGSGYMVTQADLMTKLRGTYNSDGGKEALIEKYRNTRCFVLDEVDPKLRGEDIQPFLYEILAFRHDHDLITGIGSNEDLSTLMETLGPKLEDRIAQNYLLAKFLWESYRRREKDLA